MLDAIFHTPENEPQVGMMVMLMMMMRMLMMKNR
jgi:hypothetical protein